MRGVQRGLAAAGGAVGAVRTRVVLLVHELDVVGRVVRVRDAALGERGVLLEVLEVLGQREADALDEAAVEVAVDGELVEDGASSPANGNRSRRRNEERDS